MITKQNIIVIGGGFAGLQFIKNLDSEKYSILLIDKVNHHQFQPLFYQVAAAQIEPSSISFPFRKVFQGKRNIQIRMEEVLSIDSDIKTVTTNKNTYRYDRLVIAVGCTTNFFGLKNAEEHAYTLKSTSEAIQIRNSFIKNFENIISLKGSVPEELFNIVIVGAGPTGVELAGAFAEMKGNILPKDYPGLDTSKIKVIIIEGNTFPLSNMSKVAQETSVKYLQNLGISLYLKSFVKDYHDQTVFLNDGSEIKSAFLIWTGGVKGNPIKGLHNAEIHKNGRITVGIQHEVTGHSDIYAIGDIALMRTEKYPNGHPQVANVAINQGKNLAHIFNRDTESLYEYRDFGSLATIGKYKAIADLPFLKMRGFFAWLFWMFLHLMLILSVKNKLIIFINWMWNFFTNDSSLRLILSDRKNTAQS